MMVRGLRYTLVLMALLWSSRTVASASAGEVLDLRLNEQGRDALLTIATRGVTTHRAFELTDPPRFIVDVQGAGFSAGRARLQAKGSALRVRASQYSIEPLVTRVVVDLVEGTRAHLEAIADGLQITVAGPSTGEASVEAGPDPAREVVESAAAPVEPAREALTSNSPSPSAETRLASITYLTVNTVYIDAGRDDGVQEGDEIHVMRDGGTVATLRVEHLSSRKSACVVVQSSVELIAGDNVQYSAGPAPGSEGGIEATETLLPQAGGPAAPRPRRSRGWLRDHGIRGRIGARYLSVMDRSGTGQTFSQPAVDLRVEGKSINGEPLSVSVDVRARQTYRTTSDGASSTEGRSRVYRAFGSWHPYDSRIHLTVGRQYSPDLPSLSIFDGASLALRFSHLSLGVLSGSQPDPTTFGFSQDVRENAAFLQVSSSKAPADKWYLTAGFVGSYAGGEIDREFAVLQGSFAVPAFSAYLAQDIDINRGWKLDAEGTDHTWTNTYGSMRARKGTTSVHVGYDNRRTPRLYRDIETPESEFDDAYRQGYWTGFVQRIGTGHRFGVDAKRSTGGSAGQADSYTLTWTTTWFVQVNGRNTYFSNDAATGWMHTGRIGAQLSPSLHAEIGGGFRDETNELDPTPRERLTWTSVNVDYSLGRHWYLALSGERSERSSEANDQVYVTTNYRF